MLPFQLHRLPMPLGWAANNRTPQMGVLTNRHSLSQVLDLKVHAQGAKNLTPSKGSLPSLQSVSFVLFLREGLALQLWLAWNSLCRPSWPPTNRDLPASTSSLLGSKACIPHPASVFFSLCPHLAFLCAFMEGESSLTLRPPHIRIV